MLRRGPLALCAPRAAASENHHDGIPGRQGRHRNRRVVGRRRSHGATVRAARSARRRRGAHGGQDRSARQADRRSRRRHRRHARRRSRGADREDRRGLRPHRRARQQRRHEHARRLRDARPRRHRRDRRHQPEGADAADALRDGVPRGESRRRRERRVDCGACAAPGRVAVLRFEVGPARLHFRGE